MSRLKNEANLQRGKVRSASQRKQNVGNSSCMLWLLPDFPVPGSSLSQGPAAYFDLEFREITLYAFNKFPFSLKLIL